MNKPDDFNAGSREWMTVTPNDRIEYYLSDGSSIDIHLTDIGWRIERYIADKPAEALTDDLLPYRAGAMEFVRKWIKSAGLTTVPSEAQKAAPWYDHRPGGPKDATRVNDTGLTVIPSGTIRSDPKPAPAPAFDALAFARELDAMRIAAELDALLKGTGNA